MDNVDLWIRGLDSTQFWLLTATVLVVGLGGPWLARHLIFKRQRTAAKEQAGPSTQDSAAKTTKPAPQMDGFARVRAVIQRWSALTAEITGRTDSEPGGQFPDAITQPAGGLRTWLDDKEKYLSLEVSSLTVLGAVDAFVAALIVELHDQVSALCEALVAASKDKKDRHRAKYIHYLGVVTDSIDALPLNGAAANQRVTELQSICEPAPAPTRSRAAVVATAATRSSLNGDRTVVEQTNNVNGDATVAEQTSEVNGNGSRAEHVGEANGDWSQGPGTIAAVFGGQRNVVE